MRRLADQHDALRGESIGARPATGNALRVPTFERAGRPPAAHSGIAKALVVGCISSAISAAELTQNQARCMRVQEGTVVTGPSSLAARSRRPHAEANG
jgi:hypothetical protein